MIRQRGPNGENSAAPPLFCKWWVGAAGMKKHDEHRCACPENQVGRPLAPSYHACSDGVASTPAVTWYGHVAMYVAMYVGWVTRDSSANPMIVQTSR
ncbi:hypothetical protein [Novipirellula aureliae]|uniref:hypothetical protein n=1 Tax=Novipirellula aureliae TaxID=2527966 RepID=UPI0011B55161|nr:hypothetical protein [Novipirellula aureliae]